MANWFQRLTNAISREYDRRIRRASQIATYGGEQHIETTPAVEEPEDDAVEIVNIPRGSAVSTQRDNHHGETLPDHS